MAVSLSIKDFIVDFLHSEGRPLSISEIHDATIAAGYSAPRPSIRGRLNSLTYEGMIIRVGRGLYRSVSHISDSNRYSLIISGAEDAWEGGSAKMPRSRFLEYTDKAVAEEYKLIGGDEMRRLMLLPVLFAYERGIQKSARVGRLRDLHVNRETIEIWFDFDLSVPPIDAKKFAEHAGALGIKQASEVNRTHWAIKEVDLYDEIQSLTDNEASAPLEPSPGAGPQYLPRSGKLSAVQSLPLEDEGARNSRLHARIRSDAASLVDAFKNVSNRYPELNSAVTEYSKLLGVEVENLDVVGVWSVGGALASFVQAYREQNIARTMEDPLDPHLAAALQSLVRQHGAFILGFEEGRDLIQRADQFAVNVDALKDIGQVGSPILDELATNRRLVEEDTIKLHGPIRDGIFEFGWTSSRLGYAAYLIVRNSVRAMIRFSFGDASPAAVVGGVTTASTLFGDPNAEFIRAVVPVLQQHGSQLIAFFNHSPEMRAYVEWAVHLLELDKASRR